MLFKNPYFNSLLIERQQYVVVSAGIHPVRANRFLENCRFPEPDIYEKFARTDYQPKIKKYAFPEFNKILQKNRMHTIYDLSLVVQKL